MSTGGNGPRIPRGTFQITEKTKAGKRSTLYGSAMPFRMRLCQTAIGMHVGLLLGHPASHGCIRMPAESAALIFQHGTRGTEVRIVDSWTPCANCVAVSFG